MTEDSIKAGGTGASNLPTQLVHRSEVYMALGPSSIEPASNISPRPETGDGSSSRSALSIAAGLRRTPSRSTSPARSGASSLR